MPDDEDRVLDTLNGREIFRHPVIYLIHWCKYRRHDFGKTIFGFVFLIDLFSAVSDFIEGTKTGSHKGIDRKVLEFEKSHLLVFQFNIVNMQHGSR